MVRPSRFTCSSVRLRQMSPRACLAMKLIASGVTNCAARTRSPSFSRSASSTRITMRPWRSSSSAFSTRVTFSSKRCSLAKLHEARDVLAEDVRLDAEGSGLHRDCSQADAVGGHAAAVLQAFEPRLDRQPFALRHWLDRRDGAQILDKTGKHEGCIA